MKKLVLFLMILVMVMTLSAQTFTSYTSENSDLPCNMVYCIDFDNDGNIWFGGQKDAATGLANVSMLSSDLSAWTVYQQDDLGMGNMEDRAFYIAVDNQNNKWFCTHYGVSVLLANGTSKQIDFTVDDYTRTVQTDSKGNIYLSNRTDDGIWYSEDNGENWVLWISTDIGLSTGRPEIYDLREDSQGRLWFCTWYGVVYRDTDSTWKEVADLAGEYTYAMTMDKNDIAWVPNASTNDLYKIAPDGSTTKIDSTNFDALKADILDIEADKNGHIWCATNGEGLVEILPDGNFNQYTMASTSGGILQDTLTHLEIKDDEIWVSTTSAGIVRITDLITTTEIDQNIASPENFKLHQNFPNPFNPSTNIRFELSSSTKVQLNIYNIDGQLVKQLSNREFNAGSHQIHWDGTNLQGNQVVSGIYFYRLNTAMISETRKMMFIQ